MRIFYGNNATAGRVSTLLSSSSSSGNLASNVLHPFRKLLWTTGTSTANEYLEFQFAAPVSCPGVVIWNHDFTTDTLTLKANSSSSWGSPPLSGTLTVDTVIKGTFTSSPYQYWRLEITKPTAGTIRNIGALMLGNYYDTLQEPDYDGYHEESIDPSKVTKGLGGQTYIETLDKYRVIKTDFSGISATMKNDLTTLCNTAGVGGQVGVQVQLLTELTEVIYARLRAMPKFSVSGFDSSLRYDTSLEFEEQV